MSVVHDMTSGKPASQLIRFALPTFFSILFQQLYSIVDSMIVGRFVGSDALAMIGATSTLDWLILGVAVNFTQGFAILIARNFGAKDYNSLRKTFTMSVLLSTVISCTLCVGCTVSVRQLLAMLNTPADILDGASAYLRILYLFSPLMIFQNLCSSVLRALGNSRAPFLAMTVAMAVNALLDVVLVAMVGMGVEGAAIATVVGNGVALTLCLLVLRNVTLLHPKKADWKPDGRTIGSLLKLGAPLALNNVITASGGMVLQAAVNGFGTHFVAGYTVGRRLLGMMDAAGSALSYAIMTFTSQNIGAGKPKRIRSGMRTCMLITLGCACTIGVGVYLLRAPLAAMFIGDPVPQVLRIAEDYIAVLCTTFWMLYLLMIFRSSVQGMGHSMPLVAGGVLELLVRVGMVMCMDLSMTGIYYVEPVAWALTGGLMIGIYLYSLRRFEKNMSVSPN